MESIIVSVIGMVGSVTVAVITTVFTRNHKRADQRAEARATLRAEESKLSMRLMSANNELTIATAMAVRDQKVNGRMEAALGKADAAQRAYYDFINGVAAGRITK